MCLLLKVSASAYYDWLKRPTSQREQENNTLTVLVTEVFEGQQKGCCTRTIKKALFRKNRQVSRRRIGKLMAKAGLI